MAQDSTTPARQDGRETFCRAHRIAERGIVWKRGLEPCGKRRCNSVGFSPGICGRLLSRISGREPQRGRSD